MIASLRGTRVRVKRVAGLAIATLLAAALALPGCGKNSATTVLVPTGIRPAPEVPTGGLTGIVVFDSATYPGLDRAPFPPATVQLLRGTTLVSEQRTTAADPAFLFTNLRPGDYGVVVRSHAFTPRTFGTFRVVDRTREAGDLRLQGNPRDSLSSLTYLIGTMPGFGTDEIANFTTYCDAATVGRWTYPNVLFPPVSVAAGTYRLKFVTDGSSTPGHLIGWGGDGAVTLTVPVTGAVARYGTDAASDLVVTFPTSGGYLFTFDERRLTIDIAAIPPGPAAVTRTDEPASHVTTGPTPRRSR